MRNRLALVGALVCGYAFVACGGDSSVGFSGADGGDGGSGLDATTTLGDDDAQVGGGQDAGGNGDDATVGTGGDDDAGSGTTGNDASGDDGEDSGSEANDASSEADATLDASDDAADAADATDAADANRALDASDASDAADANDAADAGDADAGTFLTPTCDGTIATGEYGPGVQGEDLYAVTNLDNSVTTWHTTWNNTALYIAIAGANTSEAAVLYLDVNGGTEPLGGTNVGYSTYDGTDPSMLPFAADAVAYMKADSSQASGTYHEYRNADLANGWSGPSTSQIQVCLGTDGTTRELVIPWTIAGTARPAAFSFFAYVTSSGGYIYGQTPSNNPAGGAAATSAVTHFFKVANSAPGNYAFRAPQ